MRGEECQRGQVVSGGVCHTRSQMVSATPGVRRCLPHQVSDGVYHTRCQMVSATSGVRRCLPRQVSLLPPHHAVTTYLTHITLLLPLRGKMTEALISNTCPSSSVATGCDPGGQAGHGLWPRGPGWPRSVTQGQEGLV